MKFNITAKYIVLVLYIILEFCHIYSFNEELHVAEKYGSLITNPEEKIIFPIQKSKLLCILLRMISVRLSFFFLKAASTSLRLHIYVFYIYSNSSFLVKNNGF